MAIRAYRTVDADACAQLYNRVFRRVPAFCPVDAPTLHHGLDHPAPARATLSAPETRVFARPDGTLAGFVAFCRRQHEGQQVPHGLVRLLCYEPAESEVGYGLLTASIEALQAQAPLEYVSVLYGGGGFLFHNFSGTRLLLSQQYLVPVLLRAGLHFRAAEPQCVIMSVLLTDPPPPHPRRLRSGLAEVVALEGSPLSYSCKALIDGEAVGECWALLGSAYSSHPEAGRVAYVTWVGTREDFQGQGIAAQMVSWSLSRLQQAGARHVYLNTKIDNVAAQALYFGLGFRVVDHYLSFEAIAGASPV